MKTTKDYLTVSIVTFLLGYTILYSTGEPSLSADILILTSLATGYYYLFNEKNRTFWYFAWAMVLVLFSSIFLFNILTMLG